MARRTKSRRRAAHALKVASRSAHISSTIKCYVEPLVRADELPDLALREKSTGRRVRVLSRQTTTLHVAPLANLLRDCHMHGGGLVRRQGRMEYVAVHAPITRQSAEEVVVSMDGAFQVKVHIATADIESPPTSVWCFIEEYPVDGDGLGVRLRQKSTGRKVELYGKDKRHLAEFLASPQLTGARELTPNLYEKDGFTDYVLVSGGTAVDSYDVVRFQDGADLTYLLGPTPDTAYRDAYRAAKDEAAVAAQCRTAVSHLRDGLYRESILAARLAVEVACGGRGTDVKRKLTGAPSDVDDAGKVLLNKRGLAVHEGDTRVEQQDAEEAVEAMKLLLAYLG